MLWGLYFLNFGSSGLTVFYRLNKNMVLNCKSFCFGVNQVLLSILGSGNSEYYYILPGYEDCDIDLSGECIYQRPYNDLNIILFNALLHPENITVSTNYMIMEQLP